MADERLERNWKMANAASENVSRPSSEVYRDNYDQIVWKKPETPKSCKNPCNPQ